MGYGENEGETKAGLCALSAPLLIARLDEAKRWDGMQLSSVLSVLGLWPPKVPSRGQQKAFSCSAHCCRNGSRLGPGAVLTGQRGGRGVRRRAGRRMALC